MLRVSLEEHETQPSKNLYDCRTCADLRNRHDCAMLAVAIELVSNTYDLMFNRRRHNCRGHHSACSLLVSDAGLELNHGGAPSRALKESFAFRCGF